MFVLGLVIGGFVGAFTTLLVMGLCRVAAAADAHIGE
jgi:hypothetical protein